MLPVPFDASNGALVPYAWERPPAGQAEQGATIF
jgi:hypothetical protein